MMQRALRSICIEPGYKWTGQKESSFAARFRHSRVDNTNIGKCARPISYFQSKSAKKNLHGLLTRRNRPGAGNDLINKNQTQNLANHCEHQICFSSARTLLFALLLPTIITLPLYSLPGQTFIRCFSPNIFISSLCSTPPSWLIHVHPYIYTRGLI